MNKIFCLNKEEDVKNIQTNQIKELVGLDGVALVEDGDGVKDRLLAAIDEVEEKYILFVPHNNILVSEIDPSRMEAIKKIAEKHDLDYVRLRRISLKENGPVIEGDVRTSRENIFFLVPYLLKKEVFRSIVERTSVRPVNFFFLSFETTGFNGGYYYNKDDQGNKKLSYFKSRVVDTISDPLVTPNNNWSLALIENNESILSSLLDKWEIDVNIRGVQGQKGCCNDMG